MKVSSPIYCFSNFDALVIKTLTGMPVTVSYTNFKKLLII